MIYINHFKYRCKNSSKKISFFTQEKRFFVVVFLPCLNIFCSFHMLNQEKKLFHSILAKQALLLCIAQIRIKTNNMICVLGAWGEHFFFQIVFIYLSCYYLSTYFECIFLQLLVIVKIMFHENSTTYQLLHIMSIQQKKRKSLQNRKSTMIFNSFR